MQQENTTKIHPVPGIRLGTATAAGSTKPNIAVIEIAAGSTLAAVFTKNAFIAHPVKVAREHLQQQGNGARYCLINSGNANAATGEQGYRDCIELCSSLATLADCPVESVLPFSTGIIGHRLPVQQLQQALPAAVDNLDSNNWDAAATAITTTDKFSKIASTQWQNSKGKTITATAIAKGAGMVCPNMATMLAFITCDETIDKPTLQQILERAVQDSFNRISVDGDTSTNDAVVLAATGTSTPGNDKDLDTCEQQLTQLCGQLAYSIVSDGEGASKVIEIHVHGAASREESNMVARTIAHSPLVKTAFFGCDPNWGRIMAAVGRAGITRLEPEKFHIKLNSTDLVTKGVASPKLNYTAIAQQMRDSDKLKLEVELGRGNASDYVISCDLGHDYVSLNSDYSS